jgi:hypothetical protein
VAMPRLAGAGDLARGNLQRREQRRAAVPHVVVRGSGGPLRSSRFLRFTCGFIVASTLPGHFVPQLCRIREGGDRPCRQPADPPVSQSPFEASGAAERRLLDWDCTRSASADRRIGQHRVVEGGEPCRRAGLIGRQLRRSPPPPHCGTFGQAPGLRRPTQSRAQNCSAYTRAPVIQGW